MLGHDVKYVHDLEDKLLIEIARAEKRILLTRDVELFQQAASHHVDAFLVEGENESERLGALSRRFGLRLELDPAVSRCPRCNAKIRPANKEEVSEKIPSSTKAFYNDFWECPKCGAVYWQGAHWKRIVETLDEAKKIVSG